MVQLKNFFTITWTKTFQSRGTIFFSIYPPSLCLLENHKNFKPSHKQNLFQSLKKTHSLIKISFKCTWHKFLKIFQPIFPQITTQFSAPWQNFNTTVKVATPRQENFFWCALRALSYDRFLIEKLKSVNTHGLT